MAVAAFKSSSRRANLNTTYATHSAGKESTEKENPQKKAAPVRRSRSVSAFSRGTTSTAAATNAEISEFLNKRDNPLFWSSGSGSPPKPDATNTKARTASNGAADDRRGRSVTKGSWVDPGRRNRSASRRRCVTSESEAEQECGSSKDLRNGSHWNVVPSNGKKGGLVRSSSGIWSGQHSGLEPLDSFSANSTCSKAPSWEDEVSTTSSVGAEEKTIKAVCEQIKSVQGDNVESDATASGIYETVRSEVRRAVSEIQNDLEIAIRRSNTTAIATTNMADIPPDLVNPGAVDLVLDIRREYAKKLEQSLERAGKLRADLAVEEHRGHELSRILKEILPDPKTPSVQKSRPGRKSSIERRKMSKRLEDEALAYFDECISLSTFDSSDFSSPEDPPLDLATPVNYSATLPQASSGTSATTFTKSSFNIKQESDVQSQFMNGHDASGLTASSSSKERNIDPFSPNSAIAKKGRNFKFSFAGKTTKAFDPQHDISKYIRNFEKHDIDSEIARSNCYNMDEYNLQASAESLLFDSVILRNRIESGSLLLCGGSSTISCSPFASII